MNEIEDDKVPGEVNCLGWCNKRFLSPDKTRIRFCTSCRRTKERATATASRADLMSMGSSMDRSAQDSYRE
jgi:hypothetical protein